MLIYFIHLFIHFVNLFIFFTFLLFIHFADLSFCQFVYFILFFVYLFIHFILFHSFFKSSELLVFKWFSRNLVLSLIAYFGVSFVLGRWFLVNFS